MCRCGAPLCLAVLLAGALLSACGASGSASSTAGAQGTAPAGAPSSSLPNPTPTERLDQPASDVHITNADCAALARLLARNVGERPKLRSEPTPPLSHCQMSGAGFTVNVYLDAGHAARQRYENRMTEQVQFGAPDPSKLPHPVPDVGDPGAYNHYASWVPAYNTLYAVRGNRWVTVAYSRRGVPQKQLVAQAAALARVAFRLSAG